MMRPSIHSLLVRAVVLLAAVCVVVSPAEAELDRSPSDDEVDYAPAEGDVTAANPPAFVWLPIDGVDEWMVEYARDAEFPEEDTVRASGIGMTVHVPEETLEPGVWYWRYGYEADGEAEFSQARAFTIPGDAVDSPFPSMDDVMDAIPDTRPRAYLSPAERDEIRNNPEEYAWLVDPVVSRAENVIERDEPLFEEPDPWDDYGGDRMDVYNETWRSMRPYTSGMEICARAYLYTGEERFAEEAKRRLMHFMTWDVEGPSSVYWPTELGMDIAENAPRTFDWVYDALTEEERETCLRVLGERIRQINEMHRGRPFESRPFSSHPGRMIGFAIEGGIILAHDIEDAPDWLEYTLRVLWSVYPAKGHEDGGWYEGVGYWTWYINRITRVVHELDRLGVPLKDKPFFQNTGDFGLYVAYPSRSRREFGDGYSGSVGSAQGNLMYSLASLYDNPYYRWHAEKSGGEAAGPEAYRVWKPDLEARAPADLPQSKAFFDVGWTALHSDMANPDENVLLIFKSSPFGSISHDHANQNAFVLEAYGEPLAISTGYYQSYGDPHHSEWVWQTKAHNAILVDGEGQVTRSPQSRGKIVAHLEEGDWAYALGDAVEAYGGRLDRAYRHVFFLRPGLIVIADDLAKADGEDAAYQWLLHAGNEMALDEDEARVTVAHGDVRLEARFLEPEGLAFSQETGWDPEPTRPEDAPAQFHFTASTVEEAAEQRFVAVLAPYRDGEEPVYSDVEVLEAEGGMALEIDGAVILLRDPDAEEVSAAGRSTSQHAALIPAGE